MPETRFLPQKTPRSTGLPRTTMAAPPPTTAGSNATSPVSAAPGVSRQTHQHVLDARNPAAAGGAPAAPRRPQDAKVQIVERRAAGSPVNVGGNTAFQTSVELLPNVTGTGGAPRAPAGALPPGVAPGQLPSHGSAGSPFDLPEALLIATLVEKYRDGAAAIADQQSVAVAQSILHKLSLLHSPAKRATNLTAASTTRAQATTARTERAAAAMARVPQDTQTASEGEPGTLSAHTTTIIMDRRDADVEHDAPEDPATPPA